MVGADSYPSPAAANVRDAILPDVSSNSGVMVAGVVGLPLIVIVGRFLYPKP